jgi:predicted  nucleic acid-binding Zn-ribbon protein
LEGKLEKQREAYEARIKEVVEENIRLAVDLKVARSGYTDAAELMMSAQSRVRDLERYLDAERQRVARLESQITAIKKAQSAADVTTLVNSLKERIAVLEKEQQQALAHPYGDGTRYDRPEFSFPEGIDAEKWDSESARALMLRLYQLRAGQGER